MSHTLPTDDASTLEPAGEPPPTQPSSDSRYRPERLHAKGGLGEVHLATDTELNRSVALKRIQPQLAGHGDSVQRFLREAEITARLEHPGIVPVYGLVKDADGQPAYAMRFVQGDTLKEAIQHYHAGLPSPPLRGRGAGGEAGGEGDRRLAFRRLLGSFVAACQAVAYAHDRGVIHRDLKPSNILLGKFGETLVVDWGLAKVVGRVDPTKADLEGTLTTAHEPADVAATAMGKVLGTPQYMSPEQAAGRWNVVGPASDVYSLGAVLYDLLANQPPISGSDKHEVLAKVQRGAFSPPRAVQRTVPRALDAVVRKAMALEPMQRYVTATALASDVEHWLADEPVSALVEPLPERARRWARKHPGPVVGIAATILIGVLGLLAGSLLLERKNLELGRLNLDLVSSNQSLDTANSELKQTNTRLDTANHELQKANTEIRTARDKAEEQRRIAQAVRDFLQNKLLGQADTRTQADALLRAGGLPAAAEAKRNPRIRELLDRAAEELAPDKIEANFPKQPLLQAELLKTVGDTYRGVGEFALAVAFLDRSASMRREHFGPDDPATLTTLSNLAGAYQEVGKLPEAIKLYEQVRAAMETTLGPEHPHTLITLTGLAVAYQVAGKLPEAIKVYERVRAAQATKLRPEHPHNLITLSNLAGAYRVVGKLPEALELYEQVREAMETTLGPEHPDTLLTLNNLAGAYRAAGKLPEAIELYEQVHAARERKLGPEHPHTLATLNNLALAYKSAGKLPEALKLYEQVSAAMETKLGPEHPDTLSTLNNLAGAYLAAGKLPQALKLYEQVWKADEIRHGPEHPETLVTLNNLARAYQAAGNLPQAIKLLEQVRTSLEKKLGPEHPSTLTTLAGLAGAFQAAGKLEHALTLFEQAAAGIEKRKFLHEHAGQTVGGLADCYERLGRFDHAETWRRKWLAVVKERAGTQSLGYAGELAGLAQNLLKQQKWAEAEQLLRECLAVRQKTQPDAWNTYNAESLLGGALLGQKKYVEAAALLVQGYEGMKAREATIPAQGKVNLILSLQRLVNCYQEQGNQTEAAKWRAELEVRKAATTKP